MSLRRALPPLLSLLALSGFASASCSRATPTVEAASVRAADAPAPDAAEPTTTTAAALPSTTTTQPAPPTTAAPIRHVVTQPHVPFATVDGLTLLHPASIVERVGFHQSNHEGARTLVAAASAANPVVLESRERLSSATTAADVVVEPNTAIYAPVSGKVLRAGTYVLYCKYSDDYAVIEPDGRPGIEVKLLHIDGEQVSPGQRVEAGVTQIANRATQLPFESQVDELRTADPAWPHVHIEVVDTSIPNIPSPGGGC